MTRGAYTLKWLRAVLETPGLRTRARMVTAALAIHLNADGEAWPSLDTLASMSGYRSLKPVRHAIEELEAAGVLAVRRGGGRKHTHRYKALLTHTGTVPAEHRIDSSDATRTVDGSPERVHAADEMGDSGDPNSKELQKNSKPYSPSDQQEARKLIGVPEGRSIGSVIIERAKRKAAERAKAPRREQL